ncbi:MAG: flavodoxin-dependent (E)-4-hydroxy-3-methylbut-2-enyl-diphosphate synthase [Bacteroidales bacterium]|jgi:(E)-4-hydroxy-3-methylbut-2-enyl-diphosphate synthase|nr:flavodoxin-dependent (E)-4-hydroxy-3-methylbut-2-enyl-diphosphate synthase [Bacteroidales bacterium]
MEESLNKYCIDVNNFERFPSRIVKVGDIVVGGLNPIRIQSMTNVPISEIDASVNQCKLLFDTGADFVRLAVPRLIDVGNLKQIKEILNKTGYKKPLIADVHFSSEVAEEAAKIVEKVRINPGNYIDNKLNFTGKISDFEYKIELEKIHEKIFPLIKICQQHGTAIRIGSNHGSLSNRILTRYGNTVEGMVESAMEFIDIFLYEQFYNLVVSMKASDTRLMVYACRLLNARMIENSCVFPQHLGVTESGEGIDGRMKSSVGIGSLLIDGIGDTLRVSLSENPENEIIFAKNILQNFSERIIKFQNISKPTNSYNPFKRVEKYSHKINSGKQILIISNDLKSIADFYYIKEKPEVIKEDKKYLANFKLWKSLNLYKNIFPLLNFTDTLTLKLQNDINYFVEFEKSDVNKKEAITLFKSSNIYPVFNCNIDFPIGAVRYFYSKIGESTNMGLIIKYDSVNIEEQQLISEIGIFPGVALIDNLCSGIWLTVNTSNCKFNNLIIKELLQDTGIKKYRAEFVSCPCCGRTSYNLEKIAKQVKEEFSHLKGLKIAVMGCIVNGPGEMSDADYGCVGAGAELVSIYKGQTPILKNINEKDAVEMLKKVIKENNDWVEI